MTDLIATLRALADPTRLRIACLIRQMELAVGEVVAVLGQSQPRISRHVRILAEAGLVERRKEGAWVFLRPGPTLGADPLGALLDEHMARDGDFAADRSALDAVRETRAGAARDWFAGHAGEWDRLRALHIAEAEVEAAMADLIGDAPVETLLDIGTGTGRMVELFGTRTDKAVAVDNSPEMLRLARAKLTSGQQADCAIDLRIGDFNALPVENESADLAIMHQVLHYAPEPARVVAEAARVLAPGGRLLIADFAAHDREELRTEFAHARLGFADDAMARWFAGAGLAPLGDRRLDGGELTVRLWLGQKKQGNPK